MLKGNNVLYWISYTIIALLASCSSVYKSTSYLSYQEIMNSGGVEYIDLRQKQAILNFIENVRTAYNRKDIDLLDKVYSNDALILPEEKNAQTKNKYFKFLRSEFKANPIINLKFENIEVISSQKFPNIYGIRLLQEWNTTNNNYMGCLYLIIDFKDGINMQILQHTSEHEKIKNKQQFSNELMVTDVDNTLVSYTINYHASSLLSEINKAYFNNRIPSLNKICGLNKDAKNVILSMWEMTPFRCMETEIIERAYKTPNGWQVRNIPLFLKNMPDDEADKEIAINFDKSGTIEDIYFTLDMNNYKAIMNSEDNEITDLRHRESILNFVEKFQSAYFLKDIDFLAKVHSDDALIISGKVIKQTKLVGNVIKSYDISKEQLLYKTPQKDYINKLRSIFANNPKINVKFDDIEVVRHPYYVDIYGLRIIQSWNTTNYSDAGYRFFLIDFDDNNNMQIFVRTWQPDKLNGKPLSEDEIFKLGDFNIR